MADYILKLKNLPGEAIIVETVKAFDDFEARDLGQIRLLATPDYRILEIWAEDRLVDHFVRDSDPSR